MSNNILWLASWYPNALSPFDGDFIQRHAKAASIINTITVLFIKKDEEGIITKNVKTEVTTTGTLTEIIIYYHPFKSGIKKFDRLLSAKKYNTIYRRALKKFIHDNGYPSLVHVHVAMKAGMLALFLKKRYRTKYVVTEHWTGYFKNAAKNIYNSGYFFKRLNREILSGASLLLPVSYNLGKVINDIVEVPFTVIPNVVDTKLFYYVPGEQNVFRFIHLSTMNYHKNPEGIIEAAKLLWDEGFQFELVMAGWINSVIKNFAKEILLSNHQLIFKNEMPYSEVAVEMQKSSALIMFSRIENLPCVILEALCCGLPVISSDVGGIKEIINNSNGILVDNENIPALKEAMKKMIRDYSIYNRESIAEKAALKFNYPEIGKQIYQVYSDIQSPGA
ncbi:MAG: hypothetical protein JWN83_746 [Chitinophagaceae bacterium]|nr:hypothetical protein [Chitinophagaceae bacterium]